MEKDEAQPNIPDGQYVRVYAHTSAQTAAMRGVYERCLARTYAAAMLGARTYEFQN